MRKFTVLSLRQYILELSKEFDIDLNTRRRFARVMMIKKIAAYCLHQRGVTKTMMGIAFKFDRTNIHYWVEDIKGKMYIEDPYTVSLWRRIEMLTSNYFYDMGVEEMTDYERVTLVKDLLDDFINENLERVPMLLGTRTRKEILVDMLNDKANQIWQTRDV